jgi:hypothetical protein
MVRTVIVMPTHRTGLLIIRAWVEEGSTAPLRAHIRISYDVSTGLQRTLTVGEPDAVHEVVDAWLQGILGATTSQARH